MNDKLQLLLHDNKEDLPLLEDKENSIKLIMAFFATQNPAIRDLENVSYNHDLYDTLGWQDESCFDVISSFWTLFACAVIREVHDNKAYGRFKRFYNFPDYINHSTPWIPGGKNGYENAYGERADSFPEKYLKLSRTQSIVESTIRSYPKLNEFARLSHSVANFMPCPSSPYNEAKGIVKKIHDFLPLFIELIDTHCKIKKSVIVNQIEVDLKTLQGWKNWLISNRKKYCLEDYYYIYTDENQIEHIKGIPFFKAQSLDYPLPRTENEIEECLDEMIKRIHIRAFRLSSL